ncbi:MAG: hypothetical protein KatS3mg001_396 [Candidatus Pacearchaeota archaeon]|nr:MAG: hypothetical protein KatS3mg001_396 [Candidatus Pacearchaeota archaeon]
MKGKSKYIILLFLFVISLISSLILSIVPNSEICRPGVGCDIVHNSSYNYTLGIQNSYYGIFIFSFLILMTFLQIKKHTKEKRVFINVAVVTGFLISLYFLYIQKFILKAYCIYCLIVDFSMVIAFLIVIFNWKK